MTKSLIKPVIMKDKRVDEVIRKSEPFAKPVLTHFRKAVHPTDFLRALKANKKALATFEGFSPRAKKEYVLWITGAKTEETRGRRLETAVE